MSSAQKAIVAELRLRSFPHMSDLRRALGLSAAEAAAAVQSLRYQGKLSWDRLELSSSMLAGDEPAPETGAAPTAAAEGGVAAAERTSPPSIAPPTIASGPDDEDDEDYPGGVNDCAEEAVEGPQGNGPLPGEGEAGDEPLSLRPQQPELPRRRMEEPRPDAALDQPAGAGQRGKGAPARAAAGAPVAGRRGHNAHQHDGSFVPKRLLHSAGIHAATTRGAARPVPVPEHEPEVARQVREEVEEIRTRRRTAISTATVSQPLELKKLGVGDLTLVEGLQSFLAESPNDLMAAILRKHPLVWRRVILVGRARGERPGQALYAALEAGLDTLERDPTLTEKAA